MVATSSSHTSMMQVKSLIRGTFRLCYDGEDTNDSIDEAHEDSSIDEEINAMMKELFNVSLGSSP